MLSEGDSARQLREMRALIARAGNGNVILNIDPNEASDALPIVRLCERARCYFVTSWNKPDDLHPWDFKYWVAHMTADDVAMGKQVGEALVRSMGGQGKMGAILGLPGNTSSQGRLRGLKQVLADNPGVELVQQQNADWEPTKAQQRGRVDARRPPRPQGDLGGGRRHGPWRPQAVKAEGQARRGRRGRDRRRRGGRARGARR